MDGPDEIRTKDEAIAQLQFYLRAALEYIDAVPRQATDALAMPGFDRDEAEALLALRADDLAETGAPTP